MSNVQVCGAVMEALTKSAGAERRCCFPRRHIGRHSWCNGDAAPTTPHAFQRSGMVCCVCQCTEGHPVHKAQ